MKRMGLAAVGCLSWIALAILGAAGLEAQVRVTYIANEGFLIEGGGKKVLIDALFAEGVRGYVTAPDSLRMAAMTGKAPFHDVDLILASHFHADHFDAETVVRHLKSNRQALFVSTPQAVRQVQALVSADKEVSSRVESVFPPEGEAQDLKRAGIPIVVLNLHHGRGQDPPVENLGFVVDLGGFTWLHIGDTEADVDDFRPYSLADRDIDLAMVPDWFLDYESFVEVIRTEIQPTEILVMHLASRSAPAGYFGEHKSYTLRVQAILDGFPDAVLLEEPGDFAVFPKSP